MKKNKKKESVSKETSVVDFRRSTSYVPPKLNVPNNPLLKSVKPEINVSPGDIFEKISGGSFGSNGFKGSGIPYIFNIMGDLLINPSTVSPSTFKKMVETDNVIGACYRYNIDSVINSIGSYVHPNMEIQNKVRKFIDTFPRGWDTFLRDILTALYAGFSVSNFKWEYRKELDGDTMVTIPLPQSTIVHKVTPDGFLQSDGVGQYVFNAYYQGYSSLLSYGLGNVFTPLGNPNSASYGEMDTFASVGNLDYPYRTYTISPIGLVWIPVDNVVKYEYYDASNNMNPYGTSMARKVYNLWVNKNALLQFLLRAVKTKSSPFAAFFARPEVPLANITNNDPNSANPQNTTNAVDSLTDILKGEYDSSSYIVLPGMKGEIYDMASLPNEANIDVMLETLRFFDDCIMTALMVPKTVFGGGGDSSGSYSLSQTHEGSHHKWVVGVRNDIVTKVLIPQVVKRFIEEHFVREEHNDEFGDFEVSLTSIDEQLKQAQIFKIAIDSGYIDTQNLNDLNHMRDAINFEKLEEVFKKLDNVLAESDQITTREVKDSANVPYAHKTEKQ